jgi:predicted CXXCH cytochrome family protein
MKRVVGIGLLVLLSLAVTRSSAMGRATGGRPSEPSSAATDSEVVSPISEIPAQACARADGGSEACAQRYPKEYREWQESVHGKAYLSGDADAPGCTDCHDDPESGDIRTAEFRLNIPSLCAGCHGDEELMRKHGIVSDLYTSYRADYHGFTIDYYRTHDASTWRYEAVCSDCHGSHAVFPSDDARSWVAPENLLETCRRCHQGAEANFTSSGAGHFRTSRDSSLLVYCVDLVYQLLIPAVIGLMAVYVALDVLHRLRKKLAEMR